jgi:hypothetical protein
MSSTFQTYPTDAAGNRLQVYFGRGIAYATLLSAASVSLFCWLSPRSAEKYIFLPMLATVVWSVRKWGVVPSIASSLTGLIGAWYCIVPPHFSFAVADPADIITLVLFVCMSGLMIVMVRKGGSPGKIAVVSELEVIETARLAMQGLLSGYCETVCACKGDGHDLNCMAHPSVPIIQRAERSIRWMYCAEEAAKKKLPE